MARVRYLSLFSRVGGGHIDYAREAVQGHADEVRDNALIEFLGRNDQRRNALYPFNSFREDYISAGFGGVRAEELEAHMEYLDLVISNARSKENEVQRLEDMVVLLREDIEQFITIASASFKSFYQYLGVKNMWLGRVRYAVPICTGG